MVTRNKHGLHKPKAFLNNNNLNCTNPATVKKALSHDRWRASMKDEFDALLRNGTWTLVPPPKGRKIIGIKWVRE